MRALPFSFRRRAAGRARAVVRDGSEPPAGSVGIRVLGRELDGGDAGLIAWQDDGLMVWAPAVLAVPCWLAPASVRVVRVGALGEWGRDAAGGALALSRHPAGPNVVIVLAHPVEVLVRSGRGRREQSVDGLSLRVADPGTLARALLGCDLDVDFHEHC